MRADLQQFLQGAVHGGIAFLHVGSTAAQSINTVCRTAQCIAHLVHAFADFLGIRRLSGSALRNLVDRGIDCGNRLSDTVKIAMATTCVIPENESVEAIEKAYNATYTGQMGTMGNAWFCDPMLKGESVTAYGIYRTSKKDLDEIFQPLDFVGINTYSPMEGGNYGQGNKNQKPGCSRNSMGWLVDEGCLYWTIRFMYKRYGLPIIVTENGYSDNDSVCLDGKVHDPQRTDFIYRYLGGVKRAISEGIPVIGYQYWSLMDNFEWAEGYSPRFGLIYIDFETQERILKDSAYEYKKIIETNGDCI